jgi:hypothetical protein
VTAVRKLADPRRRQSACGPLRPDVAAPCHPVVAPPTQSRAIASPRGWTAQAGDVAWASAAVRSYARVDRRAQGEVEIARWNGSAAGCRFRFQHGTG